jgi:AcrR family transcriptional regulator
MSSPRRDPALRPVLSRARIVETAAQLVDEAGPDALTMRAVADRMGAGAMSLYRHVSGREELLDLVLASMTAEIPRRAATGDWRADLGAVAHDIRASLLRRPQLTVLMTARAGRGGGDTHLLDRTLSILRDAGLSRDDAVIVNQALGNYVAGAALWEAVGLEGTSGPAREERRRATADALAALPADRYPGLAWVGDRIVAGDLDERFERGLALLLDGVAARLPAPRHQASRASSRRR